MLSACTMCALALVAAPTFAADDVGLPDPMIGQRAQVRGFGAETRLLIRFGPFGDVSAQDRVRLGLRGGPVLNRANANGMQAEWRVRPVIAFSLSPGDNAKLSIMGQHVGARFAPHGASNGHAESRRLGISSGGAFAIGAGVTLVVLAALLADSVL